MTSAPPATFASRRPPTGIRRYAAGSAAPLATVSETPPDMPPGRGSVLILTGRGETAASFERLRLRLALDGYTITISEEPGDSVSTLAEARIPGAPFILLGSDIGGLRALTLAGSPALRPDGVVLLGLPLLQRPITADGSAGNIGSAGASVYPVPRALPDLPILLIHGVDDQVSPLPLTQMIIRTAPRAQLTVVPGQHDVIAGPGYRTVAASTLVFLESLHQNPLSG
ncbi:alpha/beta hydrolase [Candidatus Protofrankia californiensis]|uniref:alpha/beta hydrolase n=1 Tax=Candidatus Protofrankia californiensis TaxID=1839754 RepID=UPI001040F263|nr:alpha/beta hydrolase [Candidatus Protofrankia californiensis]